MDSIATSPICIASPTFRGNAIAWNKRRFNQCKLCDGYGCETCNACSRCATCAGLFNTNMKKSSYVNSSTNVVNLTPNSIFIKPSNDPEYFAKLKSSDRKKLLNTVVLGTSINHSDDTKYFAVHLANQVNLMIESFETLRLLKTRGEILPSSSLVLYLEIGNPKEKAEFMNGHKVTHPHSWILHQWTEYEDDERIFYNRDEYPGNDLSFIAYMVTEGSRIYNSPLSRKVWAKVYIDYNSMTITRGQIDLN